MIYWIFTWVTLTSCNNNLWCQQFEKEVIKAGVTQGSVLDQHLFLVYINDLALITETKIKLFADDTCLCIEFDNLDSTSEALNDDLVNIQKWATQWLVQFSLPKAKWMICTYKEKDYALIHFNRVQVESLESHKHLGLTLSHTRVWSSHINNLFESIFSMSDIIFNILICLR